MANAYLDTDTAVTVAAFLPASSVDGPDTGVTVGSEGRQPR
ncbi:MAG: hypothetical protein U0531_18840 [Dehalococcoidia bacterium]